MIRYSAEGLAGSGHENVLHVLGIKVTLRLLHDVCTALFDAVFYRTQLLVLLMQIQLVLLVLINELNLVVLELELVQIVHLITRL